MWNSALRQADLDTSPKVGSNKLNMLRQIRKNIKENNLHQTAWTHK